MVQLLFLETKLSVNVLCLLKWLSWHCFTTILFFLLIDILFSQEEEHKVVPLKFCINEGFEELSHLTPFLVSLKLLLFYVKLVILNFHVWLL